MRNIILTIIGIWILTSVSWNNKSYLTWGNIQGSISNQTDLNTSLTSKAPIASPTFTGTVNVPILAGSTAATSATTGTISVSMTTSIITCTPTGAMTLNASGGTTGQICTFVFTTSGTSSFVITFGTNFKSTATLSTGTTTAKIFTTQFVCTNGTQWCELTRTGAQ